MCVTDSLKRWIYNIHCQLSIVNTSKIKHNLIFYLNFSTTDNPFDLHKSSNKFNLALVNLTGIIKIESFDSGSLVNELSVFSIFRRLGSSAISQNRD